MGITVRSKATQSDELLTVEQACAYLGISSATLRRKVQARLVRYVRDGHLLKFNCHDLDAYRASQVIVVDPTPVRKGRRS